MKVIWLSFFITLQSGLVFCQQNLFNVPSSDITSKDVLFFQQQINLYPHEFQLNSTFCFGLGKQMEVGFNVLGVNVDTQNRFHVLSNSDKNLPPTSPLFTLNFQKAIILNNHFKVSAGTQTGLSDGFHFVNYSFTNLITAVPPVHLKVITGLYGGTNSYLGSEARNNYFNRPSVGWHLGVEDQIVEEKFSLIAESISGKHSLSESSFGAAYYLSMNWILSCAYLIANPGSSTTNAIIAELTYSPSSPGHLTIFKHGHPHRKA